MFVDPGCYMKKKLLLLVAFSVVFSATCFPVRSQANGDKFMKKLRNILTTVNISLLFILIGGCGSFSSTYVYPPTFIYQNARYIETRTKIDRVPEGYYSKGILKENSDKICDWSGKPGEEKYGDWELFVFDQDPHQDVWLKDPETGEYVLWQFEFYLSQKNNIGSNHQ